MSESSSKFEIEPEWCSAAVLSSIFESAELNDAGTEEPTTLVAIETVAAPLATNSADSEITLMSNLFPTKPTGGTSKSRPEAKTSRLKKMPQPASANRLLAALRSRRVRIVSTVVSVLFICGIVTLNLKNSTPGSDDEITEMDLAEFNNVSGFDEPRIANASEPQSRSVLSDAEPIPATGRIPRMESNLHLLPLGLVTQTDHQSSREQTVGGLVPASTISGGSRGAMLTGQIEFEAQRQMTEAPERPFRSLGMR